MQRQAKKFIVIIIVIVTQSAFKIVHLDTTEQVADRNAIVQMACFVNQIQEYAMITGVILIGMETTVKVNINF